MKYKLQVFYSSKSGNTEQMAQAIARAQKTKSDQIPPAYPVEGQKLILIGLELGKGKVDKQVAGFIKELNVERTKNVAFFVTGEVSALDELKNTLKSNHIHVVEDVHVCAVKNGLFKAGKVSDQDIRNAVSWADKVIDSLA